MQYLFTRQRHVTQGQEAQVRQWAQDVNETVNKVGGLPVSMFERVFSPGTGTLVSVASVDDLSQLDQLFGKLRDDGGYQGLLDEGRTSELVDGRINDTLYSLVEESGSLPDFGSQQLTYLATTQAVIAPGQFQSGIQSGIEIARKASEITGTPTTFLTKSTDHIGGVMWVAAHSTIADLQKAQQELLSQSWQSYLDARTNSFGADSRSNRSMILRRIQQH